ncbi:hypothetical protein [Legionella nagasakiensis]|uniref:hypothetical protein n=1 Tax=Legionella nagasakiensis TaxID=535290 RepID=UPI0010549F03|nr:hypothetical protein [Legionella nagasakiensis]
MVLAEFTGFKFFDTSVPPRQPGDFSWLGFKKDSHRPGSMSPAELTAKIESLPDNVACVNLSGNGFGLSESTLLPRVMTLLASKPAVKEIDLSFNQLGKMSPVNLADAFREMAGSVRTVNLSNNKLGFLNFDDFKTVILAVATRGKTVKLLNNGLDTFPDADVTNFLASLDATIFRTETIEDESPAPRLGL